MAHLYDTTNNCCSASSPAEPDDISLFLQQFLIRSSAAASSSSSFPASFTRQHSFATPDNAVLGNQEPEIFPGLGRISLPELCSGLNSSAGVFFPASAVANVSSSSVGTLDNEPDEYDCESEEAIEALVEEAAPNPTQQRNSTKRSRAAEVHNLSEKRRRSRINEKMKALQNLIPNSNKTDKASMLDEAIEYLKQLQLQVQMLTMRNGLSLYPICLPGMLQPNQISQMRMDIDEGNRSLNTNMAKAISIEQDISVDPLLGLQDNCVERAPVADFSAMINSKTSFEAEQSIQVQYGPIQFPRSFKGICREEVLPFKNLSEDCSPTSFTGHHRIEGKGNSSNPFDAQPSNLKDNTLEACFTGGELPHLSNLVSNHAIFPPLLSGLPIGCRPINDNIKSESSEF